MSVRKVSKCDSHVWSQRPDLRPKGVPDDFPLDIRLCTKCGTVSIRDAKIWIEENKL